MTRQVLAGIALAIGALLTFALGGLVGAEVQGVALLGLAAGAALGLVPSGSPGRHAGAFALGVLAAWVGYLLRAVALPDATAGRLVALVVVVLLCAAVAAVSAGRLPLWAALLGAGALAGAYETVYAADPPSFLTTSPAQATAVLLAAGVGYVAAVLVGAGAVTAPAITAASDEPAAGPGDRPAEPRHLETVPEA